MSGAARLGRGDALAVLSLLGTTLLIAEPILRGGYLTYIDNAVHLAEIRELARGTGHGWSDMAFCGFPLGTLHSPLWYPALAALARHGLPLDGVYAALLVVSFMAPSTALYFVARRRIGAFRAAGLGYLLMVQSHWVWGIGSPLGGMWTYGLAATGLVVLADLWARPSLTRVEHCLAAVLLALVALTHSFAWPAAALLAWVTTVLHRRRGTFPRDELRRRMIGWAVAALASAEYWLTFLLSADAGAAPQQRLGPLELAARLLLPADAMYLSDGLIADSIRWDLLLTDAAPMFALVGLGVYGFVRARRSNDLLHASGGWLATIFFACLLVHRYVPLRFLGPVSWRMLVWVDLGLALSAVAALEAPAFERFARPDARTAVVAAAIACALGRWWGVPLTQDLPDSIGADLADVRRLWSWLERNAHASWGRIYLHDTFGSPWREGGLSHSHVLVLTNEHVPVPVLGTYYGVVPYRLRWTLSEFDSLYTTRRPTKEWLFEAMEKTNAGVLVISGRSMKEHVRQIDGLELLYEVSRYSVWRRKDAEDEPIAALSPANHVSNVVNRVGEIRFDLRTEYHRTRVLAKTAFHSFWQLDGVPGGWLRESPEGFLVVDNVPRGTFHVRLWFEPSRVPAVLGRLGWAALSVWALGLLLPALRRTWATAK